MKSLVRFLFLFVFLTLPFSSPAEEKTIGPGEYQGFIVNEGGQSFKVSPIKPGQTIQVIVTPEWMAENGGKLNLILEAQDGTRLGIRRSEPPRVESVSLEWTSNSEPKPSAYLVHIQGADGQVPGEILGQFSLEVVLWDQNDGNSGTDAPETYDRSLPLPITDAGTYRFDECFLSGTADIYDIYKIVLKPNHSLTLRAVPLQWKGDSRKGQVRWQFLNKSLRPMREGQTPINKTNPFVVKVFHPEVKRDPKPALFYLLVKIEGETSLVYSLEAEVKEGR